MNTPHTYLIILLALFLGFNGNAQDFTLTTQSEIDAFDQSITDITGFLKIETASGTLDEITNVDALSNLTSIEGTLWIWGNRALSQLDGLSNVISIGDLWVRENDILSHLDGLSNLASIAGSLHIFGNNALSQLDGLSNLTSIGGNLIIVNNDVLSQLDVLSNLTSIAKSLWINGNDALTQVDGLSNVTTIAGDLWIHQNESLTQIDGLSNVALIGGNMWVDSNAVLTQLDGLSSLTSIGKVVWINGNDALTQLDGLSNLTSVARDLEISANGSLADCCGIQYLLNTPGAVVQSITITGNPSACSSPSEVMAAACNSSTTNTDQTIQNLFELYPNPTSGHLQVDLKKMYQNIQVDVYSILGQQIKREDFKLKDQLNITMDVSAGVYFISVSVDEGYKEVYRVVRE